MNPAHPHRRFVSLRAKFLWGTLLVVAAVMGALIVIVEAGTSGSSSFIAVPRG